MNQTSNSNPLLLQYRRWRLHVVLAHGLYALALVILALPILSWFATVSWSGTILLLAALVIFAGFGYGAWRTIQNTGLRQHAEHLNRTMPELCESAELLLGEPESMQTLQRLQLKRIQRSLKLAGKLPFLPRAAVHRGAALLFAATVVSYTFISLHTWYRQVEVRQSHLQAGADFSKDYPGRPGIEIMHHEVEIVPPAYTRRSARTEEGLHIQAEEGARISWRLTMSQPVTGLAMVFNNQDTLAMEERQNHVYSADYTAASSGFYHFISLQLPGWNSKLYKIETMRDHPPDITILAPQQRTELTIADPHQVSLEVKATDDYGIHAAQIIATVGKGSGEGIKFREDTLQFDQRSDSETATFFTHSLHLNELKMAAGDELYFYVEISDNRRPAPQITRSETRFITIADTTEAIMASSSGIGIDLVPDYFRSQRQIIIDTIKLIKDKPTLSNRAFKERTNALGHDQKILRLRYGQFLGEEFESGIETGDSHSHEDGDFPEEFSADLAESGDTRFDIFDQNGQLVGADALTDPALAELVHNHDSGEATTLFSQSIRSQLKAALGHMWDAELHLRLARPEKALPFEYLALKLLKNVQQASRVYVKRIGFEPAPLRPDEKRLTAELDDIKSSSQQRSPIPQEKQQLLHNAVEILQRRGTSSAPFNPADVKILEKVRSILSRRAMTDPGGFLQGLQHLTDILDAKTIPDPPCPSCLSNVQATLLKLLPAPDAAPNSTQRGTSTLGLLYLQKLQGVK